MDRELMYKIYREYYELKNKMMQKTKEGILENSYKVAAYEEILFLLKVELKNHPDRYEPFINQFLEMENVISLIYLEVLGSENNFPDLCHIHSFLNKYFLVS